ncbi:hypothetical protein FRC19_010101 [Serendipita sp. 401]|nr:hypothetical protein FRC19_010101 [Serendipita sp. 401]
MEAQLTRTNEPPTQRQLKRIREYLESREEELSHISSSLSKEQLRDAVSQNAISNLEAALPTVREALATYQGCLGHIEAAQTDVSKLICKISLDKLDMKEEEDTCGLYEKFICLLSDYTTQCESKIDDQVELSRKETRRVQDLLRDMEMELEGWKSSHSLVTTSLKHLISNRARVEGEMQAARQALHPVRCIPSQVWIQVFRLAIDSELGDYMECNSNVPLRSTPHVLSHVCKSWRRTILEEKKLWRFAVIHASPTWSQNKHQFFQDAISKSSQELSLVMNLSQTLSWHYRQVATNSGYGYNSYVSYTQQHENNSGTVVIASSPTAYDVTGKTYQLYLDMADDQAHIMQKISQVPFTAPHTLTVSSRNPLKYGQILAYLTGFSAVKSLVIINKAPTVLPAASFSSNFPNLTSLKLLIGVFPATLQLTGYLPSTLEELYLRDDDGTSLPPLPTAVNLPRLHTLGINYPAGDFLKQVKASALKTLIFYPYKNIPSAVPTMEGHAVDTYRQLDHLKFEEWPKPDTNDESYGGATKAFSTSAQHTPNLSSLTFDQCYVDGEALVHSIALSKEEGALEALDKLEEITLYLTEGITRDHCGELKHLVAKLKIFC